MVNGPKFYVDDSLEPQESQNNDKVIEDLLLWGCGLPFILVCCVAVLGALWLIWFVLNLFVHIGGNVLFGAFISFLVIGTLVNLFRNK